MKTKSTLLFTTCLLLVCITFGVSAMLFAENDAGESFIFPINTEVDVADFRFNCYATRTNEENLEELYAVITYITSIILVDIEPDNLFRNDYAVSFNYINGNETILAAYAKYIPTYVSMLGVDFLYYSCPPIGGEYEIYTQTPVFEFTMPQWSEESVIVKLHINPSTVYAIEMFTNDYYFYYNYNSDEHVYSYNDVLQTSYGAFKLSDCTKQRSCISNAMTSINTRRSQMRTDLYNEFGIEHEDTIMTKTISFDFNEWKTIPDPNIYI